MKINGRERETRPQVSPPRAPVVHRLDFRSAYHEVDGMGFVYYGVYADWFTRGRIELLRSLGLRYAAMEREGLFLPVLRLECEYRSPIGLDEPVQVVTELVQCTRTRMAFRYQVWRMPDEKDDTRRLCAIGSTTHAFIDHRRRPVDIRKRFPTWWNALARVADAITSDSASAAKANERPGRS